LAGNAAHSMLQGNDGQGLGKCSDRLGWIYACHRHLEAQALGEHGYVGGVGQEEERRSVGCARLPCLEGQLAADPGRIALGEG
jgi:hypothetical protein